MCFLTLPISEQEDVEGVCGSALTDLSGTPDFSDRLSQGKWCGDDVIKLWLTAFRTACVMGHVLALIYIFLPIFE